MTGRHHRHEWEIAGFVVSILALIVITVYDWLKGERSD